MSDIDLSEESKRQRQIITDLRNQYTTLFATRDYMLSHEKGVLYVMYLNAVGQKQYELLCLRTDVSAIKMKVQLAQAYINKDEKPDTKKIKIEIDARLSDYYKQIADKAEELKSVKEVKFVSDDESKEIKGLYQMLVKRLHPDLNPGEDTSDLFLKAQTAYKTSNLGVLRQITLSLDLNDNSILRKIEICSDWKSYETTLKKQIDSIRQDIQTLNEQFPFNYRDKLNDQEWISSQKTLMEKEKEALIEEKERYEKYYLLMTE